ncbi:MAG: hypothetical protein QXS31_06085 [Desulfurococcaceae archaeon]
MLINTRLTSFKLFNHSVALKNDEPIYIVADDSINLMKTLHGNRGRTYESYSTKSLGIIETAKSDEDVIYRLVTLNMYMSSLKA